MDRDLTCLGQMLFDVVRSCTYSCVTHRPGCQDTAQALTSLVRRLQTPNPNSHHSCADPKLLPKRRDSLMIGTMCISYDEESLEEDLFPPLPPEAAYVTNLAVDGRFRRQGVAAALLSAGTGFRV